MEKEFVPYEQALALKVLGFDEHCIAYYHNRVEPSFVKDLHRGDFTKNSKQMLYSTDCAAPTFSQAFRWFREKHGIIGLVNIAPQGFYYYDINSINPYVEVYQGTDYDDYEEAELERLKKLIEIVKGGNNE